MIRTALARVPHQAAEGSAADHVHTLLAAVDGITYPVDTIYKTMRRMVRVGDLDWQHRSFRIIACEPERTRPLWASASLDDLFERSTVGRLTTEPPPGAESMGQAETDVTTNLRRDHLRAWVGTIRQMSAWRLAPEMHRSALNFAAGANGVELVEAAPLRC